MSSIKTKERYNWSSDDFDDEFNSNSDEVETSITDINTNALSNAVINVDIVGKTNNHIVRFDLIELENVGGRYTSRIYELHSRNGTMGLFTLLDDYFVRRFRFFHSSKTVQAFMLALHDAELHFRKKTGVDFYDYCKQIISESVAVARAQGFTSRESSLPLMVGYGISEEVSLFTNTNQDFVSNGILDEIANMVVKLYKQYLKEIDKLKYCSAIINIRENRRAFFIDPIIHLPIISYHPKFTKELSKVCAVIIFNSDIAEKNEIDDITTKSLILMPSATVESLVSICDTDGVIKSDIDLDELPFVIGEYHKEEFHRETVEQQKLTTVIGYS